VREKYRGVTAGFRIDGMAAQFRQRNVRPRLLLFRGQCAVEPFLPGAAGIFDQVVGGDGADFVRETSGALAYKAT